MASRYRIEDGRVAYLDDYFFHQPQPMPDADAGTFEQVGDWFGRDRQHVYFLYRTIVEADPASFVVLGGYNSFWAKDRQVAFWFWPTRAATRYKVLLSASLDHFRVLKPCPFAAYAADRELVYHHGKRIRGADPATFRVLLSDRMGEKADTGSHHFARDASRLYFEGKPIADADLESFRVVHAPGTGNLEYGVDAGHAYHQSQRTGKLAVIAHDQLPANVRDHLFGKPS